MRFKRADFDPVEFEFAEPFNDIIKRDRIIFIKGQMRKPNFQLTIFLPCFSPFFILKPIIVLTNGGVTNPTCSEMIFFLIRQALDNMVLQVLFFWDP